MTRGIPTRWLLVLLLVALPGCGKYGRPVRAGDASANASQAPATRPAADGFETHPQGCEDPAHDHGAAGAGSGGDAP